MNVLITDQVDNLFLELLEKNNVKYEYAIQEDKNIILDMIKNFDGLVTRNRLKIDNNFLQKAKNLRFIARYGSGMENINIQQAVSLGIKCFNSAEGNRIAVAEHALTLILCLFNRIIKARDELKDKIWNREENRGLELEGKTVGIIGYGNTGSALAEKLQGFNCRIIAYDKYKSHFSNAVVEEVNIQHIYKYSDVVSLHVPLQDDTLHLFNSVFIEKMHKPFYVINTSRGRVVNTNDLVKGLKTNKIVGAGLDVHEMETSTFNTVDFDENFNYLLNCNNVILTPHIAGLTKEANQKISSVLIEKIIKLK